MKGFASTLILLIILATTGFAQTRGVFVSTTGKRAQNPCQRNARLVDASKPMVFLSFVRRETVKPVDGESELDRLFFKLTNNFCSPIILDMSGTHKGWGDASLYYAIDDRHSGQRVSGTLYCHVCSTNRLAAGRSLTFSIPYSEADRGAVMRVAYEFEFDEGGSYESSSSLHTVQYYFSGLPSSVLPTM